MNSLKLNNIKEYCDEYGINNKYYQVIYQQIVDNGFKGIQLIQTPDGNHFNVYYDQNQVTQDKDLYLLLSPQDWSRIYFQNIDFNNYQKVLLIRPYGNFFNDLYTYKYYQQQKEKQYNVEKYLIKVIPTQHTLFLNQQFIAADKNSLNCGNTQINFYPITSINGHQYGIMYDIMNDQTFMADYMFNHSNSFYLQQNTKIEQILQNQEQRYDQGYKTLINKFPDITNGFLSLYSHTALICDDLDYLNNNLQKIYKIFNFYPYAYGNMEDKIISYYYDQLLCQYTQFSLIDTEIFQQRQLGSNQFSIYCQNVEACKNMFYKNVAIRKNGEYQRILTQKILNMYNILNANYDIYCLSEADWIQQMIISNKQKFQINSQNNEIIFYGQTNTYQVIYQGNYQQMAQINDINYDNLSLVMFINLNKFKIVDWKTYNTGEFIGDGEWLESIGIDEKKRQLFDQLFLMYGAIIIELELKCNSQHIIVVSNYPTPQQAIQPIRYLLAKYVEHKLQQFNKNNYPVIFCGDQNTTPSQINNILMYDDIQSKYGYEQQLEQVKQQQKQGIKIANSYIYYSDLFNDNDILTFDYFRNKLRLRSYYNEAYEQLSKQGVEGEDYLSDFQEFKVGNNVFHELKCTNTAPEFIETVDYIYYSQYSKNLKPLDFNDNMKKIHKIMKTINKDFYLPNNLCFSDHMPIYGTFQLQ